MSSQNDAAIWMEQLFCPVPAIIGGALVHFQVSAGHWDLERVAVPCRSIDGRFAASYSGDLQPNGGLRSTGTESKRALQYNSVNLPLAEPWSDRRDGVMQLFAALT
jgi:hypothetical protein